jgi:HEAT repeat protein
VAPHDPTPSRLLAARSLFTPARRALRFLLERLPAPAQKLGASALQAAAARWPLLSRLLGIVPPAAGTIAASPLDAGARPTRATAAPSAPAEQLSRLRGAGDYAERARAALSLARMADPEATAGLVAALRDRSSEVAVQAAEALAHHPGDVTTTALLGVLENADGYFSAPVRASAVRSLGALLPASDAASIARALADVEAIVSLAAIATLAERDVGASAGALIGLLEDRRGFYLPLTRQAAARALGRLHHYDRDRLQGVLAAEYDDVVRDALSSMAN